ncbi:MAG: family transcriptional regulator [Microbacteriaceae bacterium]|nr:family transcriptional regulator [Microbacteriaceae bacterium]
MKTQINVPVLYAALEAAKDSKGLTWRSLAKLIELSPSLFSRLANGLKPDADAFATIVNWLGVDASQFFIDENVQSRSAASQPELMGQLVPLLRARKDLSAPDIAYLEDLIAATIRRAQASD